MSILARSILFVVLGVGMLQPLWAAEAGEQPVDPQSPEAIKQMADQLEADRKAREQEGQEKVKATEEEEKKTEQVEGVGDPMHKKHKLPAPRPKPTPLPAKIN